MVSAVIVLLFLIGFASGQYLKGGLIKSFILLIATIAGMAVSLGYYETVAGFLTGYLGAKAYPLALALLFLFPMILLTELSKKLMKNDVPLEPNADRIGGAVLGAFAGYISAGMALILIGLLPFSFSWLNTRFTENVTTPPTASKALLNADGFASGFFGMLSKGSMEGSQSFSVIHADFPDQIALDRIKVDETAPYAQPGAIELGKPNMKAAGENLKKSGSEEDIAPVSGKTLMLAQVKFNSGLFEMDNESGGQGRLYLAHLRLITKDQDSKNSDEGELKGSGTAIYPAGYVDANSQFVTKRLSDPINDPEKVMQVGYYVPSGEVPVLIEFKDNIADPIRLTKTAVPAAEQGTDQASEQPSAPAAEK